MIGFRLIDDAVVILRSRGVYKQAKAYIRNGRVYAAYGAGFISLSNGTTGVPNVMLVDFELGFEPIYNKLGRMLKPNEVK